VNAASIDPSEPLLTTTALSVGYSGIAVAHDLELTVGRSEIVCLLGPNGAGKTTTLLTISGLLDPISGSIAFHGSDLKGVRPDVRARRGIVQVPEDRSLFGSLSVRENLQVASRDEKELDRVYDYFPKLRDIQDRRATVLSGGEQQMLALARAMMLRPELLIVDEMSLGLAPIVVEAILPVFRRIVDETGASVLMVEQHVHLALEVADRAYVMSRGRIIASGAAAEISNSLDDLRGSYLGVQS
jgi:branched-chain amino acid transport system ATP-binding protein